MYFRSEASGALPQLVFQGRREFKGGVGVVCMRRSTGGRGGFCSKLLLGDTCGISTPSRRNATTNWQRRRSEMSVLSSQEFEECGACFYLSSRVYQRAPMKSALAFLLQGVFGMQAGWLPGVSPAFFLSPVYLLGCLSFFAVFYPSLVLSFRIFPPCFLASSSSCLALKFSTASPSLIIHPLFAVFYWSFLLPNSLSPFQILSHMVHQCNPLPRYLIIKAVWLKKGSTLHRPLSSSFPYTL